MEARIQSVHDPLLSCSTKHCPNILSESTNEWFSLDDNPHSFQYVERIWICQLEIVVDAYNSAEQRRICRKGTKLYIMIQTVRDDDSREQHRGWQACADIRAPEVNYGRMASTSLSSWFTTTCKFQKSFRCFNLKRVSVNQLDQNSFKHLRKKSIEWK